MRPKSLGRTAATSGSKNPGAEQWAALGLRVTYLLTALRRATFSAACGCHKLSARYCLWRRSRQLAFTIHEFIVTVRYDVFTQFRLGRLEYVKSLIIRVYPSHRPYLCVSWEIMQFRILRQSCVSCDKSNNRYSAFFVFHRDTPCTDLHCLRDILDKSDRGIDSYAARFSMPLYNLHATSYRESTATDERDSG